MKPVGQLASSMIESRTLRNKVRDSRVGLVHKCRRAKPCVRIGNGGHRLQGGDFAM